MALEMRPITEAKKVFTEDKRRSVGVVFFEAEGGVWHASNPSENYQESGIGPLNVLKSGLYLCNLGYEEAVGRSKGVNGLSLKNESWLKPSIPQILDNWDLGRKPLKSSVSVAASIASRIFGLSQEVALSHIEGRSTDKGKALRDISNAPSLPTGMMNIHHDDLEKSGPSDNVSRELISTAMIAGISIPKVKKERTIDEICLPFSYPRLSYARRIAAMKVPSGSGWMFAARQPDHTEDTFIKDVQDLNRPAVFKAICTINSSTTPEWVIGFINGVRMAEGTRCRFTLEEILHLRRFVDVKIDGAAISEGWRDSSTGEVIDHLIKVCGGVIPASLSWSANAVAENILLSSSRKRKASDDPNSEAIWIAANDRIQMIPAIEALIDVGARLERASCGSVTVNASKDPEILMQVLQAAWEVGLSLPIHVAQQVHEMGVEIPTERETYYGNDVDHLFSLLAHQRNKRALWSLDAVMDVPPGEREEKSRKLLPR